MKPSPTLSAHTLSWVGKGEDELTSNKFLNCSTSFLPLPPAQAVTDFVMKTRRTPAEITKQSQSLLLTDGEWKFTNLNIIEYTEMMDDKGFSVVTYLVWQHFHIILH